MSIKDHFEDRLPMIELVDVRQLVIRVTPEQYIIEFTFRRLANLFIVKELSIGASLYSK